MWRTIHSPIESHPWTLPCKPVYSSTYKFRNLPSCQGDNIPYRSHFDLPRCHNHAWRPVWNLLCRYCYQSRSTTHNHQQRYWYIILHNYLNTYVFIAIWKSLLSKSKFKTIKKVTLIFILSDVNTCAMRKASLPITTKQLVVTEPVESSITIFKSFLKVTYVGVSIGM